VSDDHEWSGDTALADLKGVSWSPPAGRHDRARHHSCG